MSKLEPINNLLVVKASGSVLTEKGPGGSEKLSKANFARIGREIIRLGEEGINVALVTSAAISAGMERTGVWPRPDKKTKMPQLQWLASIGIRPLLNRWEQAVDGIPVGGIWITRQNLDINTPEHDETLRTIYEHLYRKTLPVVDENDAVSHEEITFGDNDPLAAILTAEASRSDLFEDVLGYVSLTSVNGFYEVEKDPCSLVPVVSDISRYEHLALETNNPSGSGGMASRFRAAKIVHAAGLPMWIANGREENAIQRVMTGKIGSYLPAPIVV